jgi:hypothetical protein
MNPEVIESQIRAFQSAATLEAMADLAWELALTLGEAAPGAALEVMAGHGRSAWLHPILAMAQRDWDRRLNRALANFAEVAHLANVFATNTCRATEDARMVAEDALVDALLALDEQVIVALCLPHFGTRRVDPAELRQMITAVVLENPLAPITWIRARRGSEILDGMPAHLRETGIFAWWRQIAEHGKED